MLAFYFLCLYINVSDRNEPLRRFNQVVSSAFFMSFASISYFQGRVSKLHWQEFSSRVFQERTNELWRDIDFVQIIVEKEFKY